MPQPQDPCQPAQLRHNLPLATSLLLASQPLQQVLSRSMVAATLQSHQRFTRGCSRDALILTTQAGSSPDEE